MELVKKYKIGPIFTPPALERPGGPLGTLMLPMDVGGANWPGGTFDPDTNQGWEATGVSPHVAVPADQALDEALRRAGVDPAQRRSLAPTT